MPMGGLLANFRNTLIVSTILALVLVFAYGQAYGGFDIRFWQAFMRWVHVFFGILWIGLLYYFNFVQIRKMPDIPAELKPAVSKYIAPEALFWFRWAAIFTLIAGVILAHLNGYLADVLTLGATSGFENRQFLLLGIGVWLAIIMAANVWMFIWPNQKVALGLVEADADRKAKAARTAMLFSRTNLLLSLPMLVSMTMSQTLFAS
jgi:uncharacterized membrane protein